MKEKCETYADLLVERFLGKVLDRGVGWRLQRRQKLGARKQVERTEDILVAVLHLVHVLVVALLAANKTRIS